MDFATNNLQKRKKKKPLFSCKRHTCTNKQVTFITNMWIFYDKNSIPLMCLIHFNCLEWVVWFLLYHFYMVCRELEKYGLPSVFIFVAVMMGCNRYSNSGKPLEAFNVRTPPSQSAVEQLLALQEAISALEAFNYTSWKHISSES